ncbi:MAG: energy transducer TonB [Bacteroidales bacterium]|jgi:outer membrane biosynthesis protein TonB|nr:energy transducer TonB [Bacteroidales bacterium]
MSEQNNRFKGIVGTIAFHLLALLAILYFALSTPLPLPGEEGVEVNLGSSEQGMGQVQEMTPPPAEQPTPTPQRPQPQPEPEPEEEMITQDVEETPAIEEEVEKKNEAEKPEEVIKTDPEPEKEEVIEEAEPEPEPEPEPPKVNERALYKGNSNTDGEGSNQGETGQPGDQGQPDGTPDATNYKGSGGLGDEGVGYDLGGRGAKHLPKPAYDSEEQGKVVVEIKVDPNGKVVSAIAGAKGTTISDLRLRRLAEEAALRSVFASDPNAPERQRGTITYNFIRLN